MSELIEPFEIRVDDAILADLHDRLTRTRFPDQIAGTGWEYGMPAPSLREFVDYWRDTYDWRAREARLNELEHFRTTIDGQAIHFVHARSTDENATPLVLVHGWPGSIVEFVEAIPLLTAAGPGACHVVAPSLPGYGFSEPTRTPRWDPKRIARAFATLMQRLGYAHYGAQGGDWGAQVTTRLAALDAEHCIGLHCNMPLAEQPLDRPELSEMEQAELAAFSQFRQNESAYAMEQSTKPQTLGAALNDSPAGLLAWIVEKFRAWSDCDGDPLHVFTRDQLIDNVMLYWVTATATSSARLYWEHAHNPDPPEFVAVPTAIARFPKEPLRFPRSWVERHYNVVRWTDMPCGGHFAAMEQPQLFADDVRSFFATLPIQRNAREGSCCKDPKRADHVGMNEHAVVIAGGGPTGLMLAAELAVARIDVVIIERRATQALDGSRAGGLYARTLEVLDQRGVAERFVAEGQKHPAIAWAQTPLDITDFPTRHNYTLALWQSHFERILAHWVLDELGVPIIRGRDVLGCTQHDDGVDVDVADGSVWRVQYLVGCDGGRSVVRKASGIDFPGLDASTSWMIAEVEMDDEPEFGFRNDRFGTHAIGRRAEGEPIRIVLTERTVEHTGEPGIDELRTALVGVYGTDFGLRRATWISRFTDMSRQAAEYRRGRVLVAGDAAHIHPPQGGQGLNTGVQDAVNLGWKLAQVVNNDAPESLLDTYHAERHPVGARVLHNTMAAVALATPDDRHQALRATMQELLRTDEARCRIAGELSALDIHYDLGGDHPLVGRRMPDLDITTSEGPTRVFALLHDAQPVRLNFGAPRDRVGTVDATYDGAWELPVIGEVPAPTAVEIRPDGYVAAVEP